MNQQQTREAISSQSSRALRRVKQNNKPYDLKEPHLAKHGLRGAHHGPNRHPA